MTHLMRASRELFRRTPDETFPTMEIFRQHFRWQKEQSAEEWRPPRTLATRPGAGGRLILDAGDDGAYEMNDWSFGQLCRLSGVAKDTVNRLSPDTAARVFTETLPQGQKPLQLFTLGGQLRSIHAASYTRLHNADLLDLVADVATDFEPPPAGFNGATGLYGGEQDMFCFLIDPAGWVEIDGQAFRPWVLSVEFGGGLPQRWHRDFLVSARCAETISCGTPSKSWNSPVNIRPTCTKP